jgi:hypothetical protein
MRFHIGGESLFVRYDVTEGSGEYVAGVIDAGIDADIDLLFGV